jgi:mannose-1-phosphate guanylyltransferase
VTGGGPNASAPVRTALVLAAGKSTRIRAVAADRPKPLIQVGGLTVLERNLRLLAQAGVQHVWINLHYQPEQIRARIGDGAAYGLKVRYSFEAELLGTAGAARNLSPHLRDERFLVVYGDNLIGLQLPELVALHEYTRSMATIAVFDRGRIPNTGLAGGRIMLEPDGIRVAEFREGDPRAASPYVNAGVYVLEPAVLEAIPASGPSDFGRDVFPALLRAGQTISAYQIDGYCFGIDTPEGLARAEALLAQVESPPVEVTR